MKLAKDGHQSAMIGLLLRDQYGIPMVRAVTGKTILQILEKNQVASEIPEDLFNLLKKSVKLHAHMQRHKSDAHSKHGLELLESKIRRLIKYYIVTQKLPEDWRYNAEQTKLIIEKGGKK